MSRTLSGIRQTVYQLLNDEFSEGVTQDFASDELDIIISETLAEISERRPYEVKDTSLTTSASYDLDISSIEDLLEVDKAEFPISKDPPNYRNVSVFGTTLTIDIDTKPTADKTIYLFCHKLHQLTEESSTLSPQLETLLIAGSVAKAALGWTNQVRKQVTQALARIADVHTAIGNMSDRVEQAIADLGEGRDLGFNKIYVGGNPLGDHINYAGGEIRNASSGYRSQSEGFLRELSSRLSITGVINTYQTWANNKLVLYQRDLKRISRPRTYRTYPRD